MKQKLNPLGSVYDSLRQKKYRVFKLLGIFLFCSLLANAQQLDVSGVVTDSSGEPLPGVNVFEQANPTAGVITNYDGEYAITVSGADAQVTFSFIGFTTQVVNVAGRSAINVTMTEETLGLDEVVVVGFGTQKKVNVTGAVSSVDAEALSARPVNNAVEALQGLVPGMNISTGDAGGALNSNKKINIRGVGTIGAGSNATPLVLIDGMEGDINMVNPQDIENISILKDAAASSIYGSRAPAGVILITTKKGKAGTTIVNYNNSFRFDSPMNMPEMADSYEFANYFNDAQLNGNMFTDAKLEQIKDYRDGKIGQNMFANSSDRWEVWDNTELLPAGNTDWLDVHFGNSFSQEHSLSANGGSEKVQYYFSGNFLDQTGLLNYGDDNKQRYSVNAKINTQLTDHITASYNVRFVRSDYDAPSYLAANNGVFYHNVMRYWPIIPVKDPNGYYNGDSKIEQLTNGGRYITQNDVVSQQLHLTIEPVKDWKINAELNYRSGTDFRHTSYLTTFAYDINENPFAYDNHTSSVSEEAYKTNFFNPNIFTEYSWELGQGHNFKVMGGFQSEIYKSRNLSASKDNVQANDIPTLNTTERNPLNSGGYAHWSTAGFFGRVNYDYQGRYLAEVNMRYDGTSRFLEEERWNVFPSFSLGWNVARENFFEDYLDVVNTFKLRGSWGELGNQNTDNFYPFYRTIRYNKNDWGGFAQGGWLLGGQRPNIAQESGLVSSLLTWERIRTVNLGFDFGMLRNRLTGSFDWFKRSSLDMVGPAPELPETLGIGEPKINNLDMESTGYEIQVAWRDQIDDFRYGVTLNMADSRQKVTKYPNPAQVIKMPDGSTFYYSGAYLGDIWGFETKGIAKTDQEMNDHLASLPKGGQGSIGRDWAAGDIMYVDRDGSGSIDKGEGTVSKPGDQRIIGNSTPRYNFGLNLDAAYKGFDLKVFLQGTLKRDYMPGGPMFWGADGGKWQSVAYKPHLDYFRDDASHPFGENLNGYYPRPDWGSGKNRENQTRYLQNAAYARLKNVTLGYTLPSSITDRINIDKVRLFVSAENLATITELSDMYDPETLDIGGWGGGKTYPLAKTVSMGLSVTF